MTEQWLFCMNSNRSRCGAKTVKWANLEKTLTSAKVCRVIDRYWLDWELNDERLDIFGVQHLGQADICQNKHDDEAKTCLVSITAVGKSRFFICRQRTKNNSAKKSSILKPDLKYIHWKNILILTTRESPRWCWNHIFCQSLVFFRDSAKETGTLCPGDELLRTKGLQLQF